MKIVYARGYHLTAEPLRALRIVAHRLEGTTLQARQRPITLIEILKRAFEGEGSEEKGPREIGSSLARKALDRKTKERQEKKPK